MPGPSNRNIPANVSSHPAGNQAAATQIVRSTDDRANGPGQRSCVAEQHAAGPRTAGAWRLLRAVRWYE